MSELKKSFNNKKTLLFVVVICFTCAFILSVLASFLKKPQEEAAELYQSKQLLISAKIISYNDTFQLFEKNHIIPAKYDTKTEQLVPSSEGEKTKRSEVLALYSNRVEAKLVDDQGQVYSFEDLGLNQKDYIEKHKKLGYSHLKYKLIYFIFPNLPKNKITETTPIYGYVIPINGFGLWDAIYGYLCLAPDGNTVIGATWYNQKETPGLGGEIGTPDWQKQFTGKKIFRENAKGDTNFLRAPLGIQVVKSTVKEKYGNSPEGLSAVDGIAGATITITGVTEAYRSSLSPYRSFLIKVHNTYKK